MKRRKFPKHLGSTPHEWRQVKRQEWKRVMNALKTFEYGSAYTPTHADFYDLMKYANRITEDMEGDWIAW